MRSLKFHSIRARNILCFGPEGIEIDFSKFEKVNQIRGINLDAPGTDEDPASNGAGKSSIQELMSIALYGRTVKKPTKNKSNRIVNVLAENGEVEIQWDDCRVVRSFKKTKTGVTGKLEFWKSPTRTWDAESKVTFNPNETQIEIEKMLGLSHHAFCNIVIFDDSRTYSFLEADTPTKREIVENLLDLEQYRGYHENCKALLKELKKQVDHKSREYEHLKGELDACERRVVSVKQQEVTWKNTKQIELTSLQAKITAKQQQLATTNTGKQLVVWQNAQDRIIVLSNEISESEAKRLKFEEAIKSAREKVEVVRNERQDISNSIKALTIVSKAAETNLNKSLNLIKDLQNLKSGATCQTCLGKIDPTNFGHVIEHSQTIVNENKKIVDDNQIVINEQSELLKKKSAQVAMMDDKIEEAQGKANAIEELVRKSRLELNTLTKIPKPEGNVVEQILENEVAELKNQLISKQNEMNGQSPYKNILDQAEQEVTLKVSESESKAVELQAVEKEVPYYEFWSEAFGDNGIRKFVIDGIIPALNERIAYWLQILIDGLIELTFDNKLEETITRNGNPAFYSNMSNGEVQRINLAISQSFSYVMMLNSGCCPNIVFLDEITGGGIDRAGVPFVYNMIFELAKERQVFVTTHNDSLMSLLHGCETLTLKKQNDITILVS